MNEPTQIEQDFYDRGVQRGNFSIDLGWEPLVEEVTSRLDDLIPGWMPIQVKQKFGTLRFYFTTPVDAPEERKGQARDLVDEAERKSSTICERCGKSGTLRTRGFWMSVTCDEHAPEGAVVVPENN